ncbi:MAG: ferritin-like domain-containing protein [Pseudonocardiaceae bacterium]
MSEPTPTAGQGRLAGPVRAQATATHFSWPELVAVTDLASACRAIEEILEQGEGPRGEWRTAHFGQFVALLEEYQQAREANPGFDPVRPVVVANVRPCPHDSSVPLISDPVTAGCTDLFNVAYEILLQALERYFAHTEETDAQLAALADLTIALMFQVIKPLGELITTLPAGPDHHAVALADAAQRLVASVLRPLADLAVRAPNTGEGPVLAIPAGGPAHERLDRVAAWLAEVFGGPALYSQAYGGYSRMISQHLGKCLSGSQRARWVALLSQSAADAGLPADPEFQAAFASYLEWGSRLTVENYQTLSRPPATMPMPHWWWVCNATPGSRISALDQQAEPSEESLVLPGPGAAVSFAAHVKPLFRARDRQSMRFAFDLWSYPDVVKHADAILDQVRAGSMPCDSAWPAEHTEVFARWIDGGKNA